MKKILFLIFIATSAAAQTISCAGSNWTGTLWQMCVIDNSNPIVINICTINPGCTNQSQWQVVGGGGTGSVTTSGSPATGTLSEFSGPTVITNSPLSDNGSIVSSSENFNAPQISTNGPSNSWFTGTGSLIGFNEGTCTGPIPSLTDWLCDSNSGLELGVAGGAFHTILYNGATFNATTATNLASYPTLCSGNQVSQGLSSGSNNCTTISKPIHGIGATFPGAVKVICCYIAANAGTIIAWDITVDDGTGSGTCASCTASVIFWRVSTGTTTPTSSNAINTAVSLSTGTNIHSTTLSAFSSTAVAANDVFAIQLSAVANAVTVTTDFQYQ